MDDDAILNCAVEAAYAAGKVLQRHFGRLTSVAKKGAIDLLTEADTAAEKTVVETIGRRFAHHSILAEEGGRQPGDDTHCWIIDPLDGTTNYAHGIAHYSVSIAYFRQGRPHAAVVLNPASGELFSAVRNKGARCNDKSIAVSARRPVGECLLVTGFPYDLHQHLDELVQRFGRCLAAARGIRRLGSAALDLCYVACGRFDGFWEQNLKPWDTAAGWLIVTEAGGRVTDFSGRPFDPEKRQILATNGRIHDEMMQLLTSGGRDAT